MATVQSIDRALDIIELLSISENALGVTEIGVALNLHKSTVHRLLKSLENRGYVEKNKIGYLLGLKIVEISSMRLKNVELKTESAFFLNELSKTSNQTVHLAIRDNHMAMYIDKIERYNKIRMYSQIGKKVPLYCTAVGKALLSEVSKEELVKILKKDNLISFTKNTNTDLDKLYSEIQKYRKINYFIDDQEHENNIYCIAAPIKDYRGKIIAAISISGIKKVVAKDKSLVEEVKLKAYEISKRMGFNGGEYE